MSGNSNVPESVLAAGAASTRPVAFVAAAASSQSSSDTNNDIHNTEGDAQGDTTDTASDQPKQQEQEEPQLQLLPPSDEQNNSIPTIKLGETLSFEAMGPIIINVDGSTRRIDNWDAMTEAEQKVAWRRISKRNEERRKQLLEKQQQEQQEAEETDSPDKKEL